MEYKSLDKYFKGVNYVFHLAGLADIVPSIENPSKYYNSNVIGTLNVIQAAKKIKLKKKDFFILLIIFLVLFLLDF